MRNAMTKSEREFTGRHMLVVMVCFFGVIISVNLLMATFASSSWTGLIVKNSYVASQDFNGHIAAARQQDALGWSSEFSGDARRVSVTLEDAKKRKLTALSIDAKVYRPVAEADDRRVTLIEGAAGTYGAAVELGAGVWEADIKARGTNGEVYRQIFRFAVEAERK